MSPPSPASAAPGPSLHHLFVLVAFALPAAVLASGPPLRIAGEIAGEGADLELRDLPQGDAETALTAAWAVLAGAERELSSFVEQIVGQGRPADPAARDLVSRGESFCHWSDGALSPLGAPVYRLWEAGRPTMADLDPALAAARCDRMRFEAASGKVELVAGTVLDFRHFFHGWAVDRAAAALAERGARNFRVRYGAVARGAGPGPDGRGWSFAPVPGTPFDGSVGTIYLKDQAVALAIPGEHPLRIGGESVSRWIDLRSGKPAAGIAAVIVATELALDAEPLAAALVALGPHGGQQRLGSLRPKPAALWLLGQSESEAPVLSSYNWSAVHKR